MAAWDDLILAHFDKKINHHQLLEVHLKQTAAIMLESLSAAVKFDVLQEQELQTIVAAIGKFHDLGKFTDFFQSYIKNGNNPGELKNHSHISALALYRYMQLTNPLSCDSRSQEVLLFLVYLSVRLHHSHLTTNGLFSGSDVMYTATILRQQTAQLLKRADQIKSLYETEQSVLDQILDIVPLLHSKNLTQIHNKLLSRRKHERWYFILLYLFSLLIDSDKLDSAQLGKRVLADLSPNLVTQYLHIKHGKDSQSTTTHGVNNQREKARRSILAVVESLSDDQLREYRLFTLTAPTGIGKTLSSLQAALVLREKLKPLLGRYPRIITAIPFINILQGTEKDYRGTLGEQPHLIVHHQNADFYASKSSEDVPLDKKLLEVESWEGDIILTTFVQLFQSLFTGNNRRLKKLNKLAGSIVILDEIQSIPEKYMPLIGACLIKLGEYYGTRFILMTATQPKIIDLGVRLLEESNSSMPKEQFIKRIELLPDYPSYFQSLKRTKIIPVLDRKMNINEFVDFFLSTWKQRSSLIVVNTIKQSLELYRRLIDQELEDTEIRYLSTNLLPKHRKATIEEVNGLLESGRRVILVSTQTIEAGVDLDFEVGYRALAPLESIVQTAGRVNRKGMKVDDEEKPVVCPVFVLELGDGHHYVYDLQHLERTRHFLSAYAGKEIAERDYQSLIESYYAELYKHPIADASSVIWDGIMTLSFDKIQQFQLIEKIGEVADVFVEWDEEASRLADCYCELKETKTRYDLNILKGIIPADEINKFDPELNFHQRKALLKIVMSKMGDYMIQIRYTRLQKNRPFSFTHRCSNGVEAPFFWVPAEELKRYYNPNIGYLDESGEAYLI
jgi:CRISPR-associated endonuclease/helicase Cas3